MFGLAFLAASAAAAEYELHWIVPPSPDYYPNWISNKTFEVGDSVSKCTYIFFINKKKRIGLINLIYFMSS